MVLNLYSYARRRSCLWCARGAFNHPILDDPGRDRGFGGLKREGRHAFAGRPCRYGVLWRCPTLPQPVGCSTIGAAGLSFQVRNVAGRFPGAVTTTRLVFNTSPPSLFWGWGGCGLIVVCIVVAALLFAVFVSPSRLCWVLFSVGQLVPVGSRAPRGASTSGLSTR